MFGDRDRHDGCAELNVCLFWTLKFERLPHTTRGVNAVFLEILHIFLHPTKARKLARSVVLALVKHAQPGFA